jgi:DivIVA domain-containing protein
MPDSLWQASRATIDGMAHVLLLLLAALVVGAVAYGVTWVVTGRDRGLDPEEPDGRGVPLPAGRPLVETDIETVRFDLTLRGYRMDQVDAALRRAAYDLGYKTELIEVLEAEIDALREGRTEDAEAFRIARRSSQATGRPPVEDTSLDDDRLVSTALSDPITTTDAADGSDEAGVPDEAMTTTTADAEPALAAGDGGPEDVPVDGADESARAASGR